MDVKQIQIATLLCRDQCTALPGVFDPLSAKIAHSMGFDSAVLTGYSLSATYLGEPDIGLMTQSELLHAVYRIKMACPELFLLVDGDNGHGSNQNVVRLVRELCHMQCGGVILEDQIWPKKCGHMEDKQVVSQAEFLSKLKAALDTRPNEQFLVVARTDARAIEGLEQAIERAQKAVELGVDMVFIEAPQSTAELEKVAKHVNSNLIANMVPGGKTPLLSREELTRLGYSAVFYPLEALFSLTEAIQEAFGNVKADNLHQVSKTRKVNFDQFNQHIGLEKYIRQEDVTS
ncbi:MAG: oxaloacetate decarboxylase [Gammaproteobacteria bacterium]